MACLDHSLSLDEAIVTSIGFTAAYVGVLYLPFNSGPRHAPSTIVSRLLTLTVLTILLELYVRFRLAPVSYHHSVTSRIASFMVGSALTLLLYMGHILATPLHDLATLSARENPFQVLRNYVFAPLLEEIVFRRQSLLIWSCQHPMLRLIFPAAAFALAHSHHAWALGMVGLVFQLSYTFLFGVYAAALYCNTLSVGAPFAAHVVCNILELPDFIAIASHRKRHLIYIAYAISLLCFVLGFLPLTEIVRPYQAAFQ